MHSPPPSALVFLPRIRKGKKVCNTHLKHVFPVAVRQSAECSRFAIRVGSLLLQSSSLMGRSGRPNAGSRRDVRADLEQRNRMPSRQRRHYFWKFDRCVIGAETERIDSLFLIVYERRAGTTQNASKFVLLRGKIALRKRRNFIAISRMNIIILFCAGRWIGCSHYASKETADEPRYVKRLNE